MEPYDRRSVLQGPTPADCRVMAQPLEAKNGPARSPIALPTDWVNLPPSRWGRIRLEAEKSLPSPAYRFARRRYHELRRAIGRTPGRGRLLPDYLIIGVAKGGTTTLCAWLNQHPFVAPAAVKEVHYFDYQF